MSRTGTKSFAVGMQKLGFNSCHNGGRPLDEDLLRDYDAFSDSNTCMFHYKYLYERYPDAKFVFSYRDAQSWADKIVEWYNPRHGISYIHWHLNNEYVSKTNTREELVNFAEWQYESVMEFFSDKQDQFLAHSVFKGDTFEPIAKLVGINLDKDFSIDMKDQSVKDFGVHG